MTLYFRTREEQKTEHALLSLVAWFQAQPQPFLAVMDSELTYFLCWTWNLRLSTLSSSQWSLSFQTYRLFLYLLSQCDNCFCTVGFKVFSASRASRLQLSHVTVAADLCRTEKHSALFIAESLLLNNYCLFNTTVECLKKLQWLYYMWTHLFLLTNCFTAAFFLLFVFKN